MFYIWLLSYVGKVLIEDRVLGRCSLGSTMRAGATLTQTGSNFSCEVGVRPVFLHNLHLGLTKELVLEMEHKGSFPGIAAVPVLSVRPQILDLLVLTTEHQLVISTYHGKEIPIDLKYDYVASYSYDAELSVAASEGDISTSSVVDCQKIVSIRDAIHSGVTVVFEDGSRARINVNLIPKDDLTSDVLAQLGNYTDPANFFDIHMSFLENWFECGKACIPDVQFECLSRAVLSFFGCIPAEEFDVPPPTESWLNVLQSPSAMRLRDDTALMGLRLPIPEQKPLPQTNSLTASMEKRTLMSLLSPLHFMAEEMRLFVPTHSRLSKLARLIIRLARPAAPGWAEYWKRLIPGASESWNLPRECLSNLLSFVVNGETNSDTKYIQQRRRYLAT